MVRQRLDAIHIKDLRHLLDLFATKAIDYPRLPGIGFDVMDDLTGGVPLGANLVKEIFPIERKLENRGAFHAKVLKYILLHLRRGGGRKRNDRGMPNPIDHLPNAPIFWTEIVPPLRYAMRLVNGVERNLEATEKLNILLFHQ